MKRSFPLLAVTLLLITACSTSKPRSDAGYSSIDPTRDPSVAGSVVESVRQGAEEAAKGAEKGRRIGRVAGVIAAVFGGPSSESLDDTIDRYRRTRDAAEIAGAVIGATIGGIAGAEEGFESDQLFAALHGVEGLDVFRPTPDQIDIRLPLPYDQQLLVSVASILAAHEQRTIAIKGPGETALDVRETLIDLGVPSSTLTAHRSDDAGEVVLQVSKTR